VIINDRTSSILVVRRYANELPPTPPWKPGFEMILKVLLMLFQAFPCGVIPYLLDMWPQGGDDHPNDPDRRLY
jgi:hypothetical protein